MCIVVFVPLVVAFAIVSVAHNAKMSSSFFRIAFIIIAFLSLALGTSTSGQ